MTRQDAADRAEELLDEAEAALDDGDAAHAIDLCREVTRIAPDHPGAHFVRGDALRVLGRLDEAADAYRSAALARSDHASSWSSLALTQFELLELAEARRSVDRAIREDPRNPEGWWVRSLVLEQRGDLEGARRALAHARWLDPEGFRVPPELTDEEIADLVEQAIAELHPTIREYLANVAILLEEMPDEQVLREYDPPLSPLELLGYFSGASMRERSVDDPWSQMPGTIVLFRRNLQRHAADRDELIDELRVTLFHEVGHFLGLDEDDLAERGLD